MDIVSMLQKERVALMTKVNAIDVAIRLLSADGNVPQTKTPMSDKDRRRRSTAMKASWKKRRAAQKK